MTNAPETTGANHKYITPTKHILSPAHLAAFQRSQTHTDLLSFIDDLNDSVVGVKLTEAGEGSEVSAYIPLFALAKV